MQGSARFGLSVDVDTCLDQQSDSRGRAGVWGGRKGKGMKRWEGEKERGVKGHTGLGEKNKKKIKRKKKILIGFILLN